MYWFLNDYFFLIAFAIKQQIDKSWTIQLQSIRDKYTYIKRALNLAACTPEPKKPQNFKVRRCEMVWLPYMNIKTKLNTMRT